jgi:hypothetical protein
MSDTKGFVAWTFFLWRIPFSHAGAITIFAFLSENWPKMPFGELEKYAYCSIAGEKKV